MNINERLSMLRQLMDEHHLDAYIIPSSDPHMSEYVAEHWKARAWISGFSGSAGTVVVTQKESGLWTDGRYFIQAQKELDGSEIKLYRMGVPGVPDYLEWLVDRLDEGSTVGFSGKVISLASAREMEKELRPKKLAMDQSHDLVGAIWENRPALPDEPIFVHDVSYAGLSAREKIDRVMEEMKKYGADHYLISSLDDIAWLYNIRGSDIPFVPVALAYALISPSSAYLFIDPQKVSEEAKAHLEDNEIHIRAYNDVIDQLKLLEEGSNIIFDPMRTNCWLCDAIPPECGKVEQDEITAKLKTVKNETEIENLKACQVRDGVAMAKFLFWLHQSIEQEEISERSLSEKLEFFRGQQDHFRGPSFNTIAAYKDHGAMMHYAASEESSYILRKEGMLVLDSGGQYLDGTTDITRTLVLGKPSQEEKRDFTLVLKAHIALARAKFLYGATGSNLDVLARQPIWNEGMDYKSGTGHGVGFFLSVHEGPQRISQIPNKIKLEKGMTMTDEPGIYKEGKYGIRTENILLVTEAEKTGDGQFMRFEVISFCPIDREGIDVELLSGEERRWIDGYHAQVYGSLSPYLDESEKEWLRSRTRPL